MFFIIVGTLTSGWQTFTNNKQSQHDTHNQYNRKRQHNNKYRPKPTPMNLVKTKYEIILKIIDIGSVLPEKPNITKLYLPSMGRKKKWWYDNSRQKRKSSYQNPPIKQIRHLTITKTTTHRNVMTTGPLEICQQQTVNTPQQPYPPLGSCRNNQVFFRYHTTSGNNNCHMFSADAPGNFQVSQYQIYIFINRNPRVRIRY